MLSNETLTCIQVIGIVVMGLSYTTYHFCYKPNKDSDTLPTKLETPIISSDSKPKIVIKWCESNGRSLSYISDLVKYYNQGMTDDYIELSTHVQDFHLPFLLA